MNFQIFIGEWLGTFMLTYMGCSTVAGVLLNASKSYQSGWLVITLGWALAVMLAIYVAGPISGAHLNPAVSIAFFVTKQLNLSKLPHYLLGQFSGAFMGGVFTYFHFYPHWSKTEDIETKLDVFCTRPAICHTAANFFSEFMGSFILMVGIMAFGKTNFAAGLNPLIIALLITAIGLALGGTTGWAINPARDLGPRLAHFLLPIPGKGTSNWQYAWIPVVAPVCGCTCGAAFYQFVGL